MLVWDELNRPWIEHWGIPQKKDPELLVLNHLILRLILKKYPVPDAPCMEYLPTFSLKITQFCR
jgi:hypothetical protein